jgi:prepilin-type N-terminal cleavage/methylation domain-containing protein
LRVRVQRIAAGGRSERGFTLVEMLVSILLLVVALGVLMAPMVASQRVEQRAMNYAYAQQEARTGVESIVAQLRQATQIGNQPSLNTVVFNVTLGGQALTVEYECDIAQPNTQYQECVRVYAPQGTAPPTPTPSCTGTWPSGTGCQIVARNLINGTTGAPVFAFGPDPNTPYADDYMTATLQVPSSGGQAYGLTHPIVLSDGTLMRNLNAAN